MGNTIDINSGIKAIVANFASSPNERQKQKCSTQGFIVGPPLTELRRDLWPNRVRVLEYLLNQIRVRECLLNQIRDRACFPN